MSKEHRGYVSELLECQPTVVHAADFGHISRSRLIWGLAANFKPLDVQMEFFIPGTVYEDCAMLRWLGPPWPPKQPVSTDGFVRDSKRRPCCETGPALPGCDFRPTYPGGRFLTLTTCFPHPADRAGPQCSADVYSRFEQDGRRFLVAQYVEGDLLYRGDKW